MAGLGRRESLAALHRRDGQREAKRRPAAGARLARDAAPVRLDDVTRDGQAEPRPLALRREERVEDPRADVLRDAAAPVRRRRRRRSSPRPRRAPRWRLPPASPRARCGAGSGEPGGAAPRRRGPAAGRPPRSARPAPGALDLGARERHDLAHRRPPRRRPPSAAAAGGRRAGTPRSGARGAEPRAWMAASRFFTSGRAAPSWPSSSSSISTLRPIADRGLRISCVTCAAILPMAARRSLDSASACARDSPDTIFSNAASSCPISSSLGATVRAREIAAGDRAARAP